MWYCPHSEYGLGTYHAHARVLIVCANSVLTSLKMSFKMVGDQYREINLVQVSHCMIFLLLGETVVWLHIRETRETVPNRGPSPNYFSVALCSPDGVRNWYSMFKVVTVLQECGIVILATVAATMKVKLIYKCSCSR